MYRCFVNNEQVLVYLCIFVTYKYWFLSCLYNGLFAVIIFYFTLFLWRGAGVEEMELSDVIALLCRLNIGTLVITNN